jgi:hypothetical protein
VAGHNKLVGNGILVVYAKPKLQVISDLQLLGRRILVRGVKRHGHRDHVTRDFIVGDYEPTVVQPMNKRAGDVERLLGRLRCPAKGETDAREKKEPEVHANQYAGFAFGVP